MHVCVVCVCVCVCVCVFPFDVQVKHMIMLKGNVIQELIQFLEHCERATMHTGQHCIKTPSLTLP